MASDAELLALVAQVREAKKKADAAGLVARSTRDAARMAENESAEAYETYRLLRSELVREVTGEDSSFFEWPSTWNKADEPALLKQE